jgi:esterase/lipase
MGDKSSQPPEPTEPLQTHEPQQYHAEGEDELKFSPAYYQLTVAALSFLEKFLKLKITLHADEEEIKKGDIYLFNHFARFETFIPPYLIYKATGQMSRSVASSEFFTENDTLANYLRGLGAVPNDYPNLFPFLASELVRGRKVILFPEGGMVKDRRVVDKKGRYGIYSRTAEERRKHHTGAAAVAMGLDLFKQAVRRAKRLGDDALLARWGEMVGDDGRDRLIAFAERPTTIVPANITFYPIRVDENLLERAAALITGDLGERLMEELRIEGNILLKPTDMDIRLGESCRPDDYRTRFDRMLFERLAALVTGPQTPFELSRSGGGIAGALYRWRNRSAVLDLRDDYMERMYTCVSINLSHVVSALIFRLMEDGVEEIERERFHRMLYLVIKYAQATPSLRLHRSLVDIDKYAPILEGMTPDFEEFLEIVLRLKLLEFDGEHYRFLPKLLQELEFDTIRLENPVMIYTNEVMVLDGMGKAERNAIKNAHKLDEVKIALHRFDDELVCYEFDRRFYSKEVHREINEAQTFTEDPKPFLLRRKKAGGVGVLLVHGFSASPAEVRALGDKLFEQGHTVLGVRLRGHGTSPWDMRDRKWGDWVASVERGRAILEKLCDRVAVVGFSTGGLLGLYCAAKDEAPSGFAALVSVCSPLKLRDKAMLLVPLLDGANRVVGYMTGDRDVKPFQEGTPEHPEVNYRHMPVRSLSELYRFMGEVKSVLGEVRCPTLVIQGDEDPTVDPSSAERIYSGIASEDKTLVTIPSTRHGILYEDIGDVHGKVLDFIADLD